jgi:hypothetical protein
VDNLEKEEKNSHREKSKSQRRNENIFTLSNLRSLGEIRFLRGEMAIFIGEIGKKMTLTPIFRGKFDYSMAEALKLLKGLL